MKQHRNSFVLPPSSFILQPFLPWLVLAVGCQGGADRLPFTTDPLLIDRPPLVGPAAAPTPEKERPEPMPPPPPPAPFAAEERVVRQ